jgi:uncharacterized protein YbjT (DUF2867 family)
MRFVPLLVEAGHTVGAMTRSAGKSDQLASLGAEPIVCDVFDREALRSAVHGFEPDLLLHQLTDLPDAAADQLARRQLSCAAVRQDGPKRPRSVLAVQPLPSVCGDRGRTSTQR